MTTFRPTSNRLLCRTLEQVATTYEGDIQVVDMINESARRLEKLDEENRYLREEIEGQRREILALQTSTPTGV